MGNVNGVVNANPMETLHAPTFEPSYPDNDSSSLGLRRQPKADARINTSASNTCATG